MYSSSDVVAIGEEGWIHKSFLWLLLYFSLQMGIVEQYSGTYYSLRLEGMKEEFDKLTLSILEPIDNDGKTEWVERTKAK